MGYYIETPVAIGKAKKIVENHGAMIIPRPKSFEDILSEQALICVVSNGPFEAAGYCFDGKEFEVFSNPQDPRPKTWLVMDKEKAEELTGYKGE